jgi:methylthioribulose-1-phosphate dehydratase
MAREQLQALLKVCEFIANMRLSSATGGNFSIRWQEQALAISASGKDKSELTVDDFVVCDLNAKPIKDERRPSAETALHGMIYQMDPKAQCVLHTHSVPVTALSLYNKEAQKWSLTGYEMQKVISGFTSHEQTLEVFIFDNDQDIPRLAQAVKEMWPQMHRAYAFMVRGHGLYTWGTSVEEAKRHMEGLEFLFSCELTRLQLSRA